MDYLTFISKLVDALAWPAAALIAAFFLREELKALIPYIKRLKLGGMEAEFERILQEASEDLPPQVIEPEPSLSRKQELIQLARSNPRDAIIAAWTGIEIAVRRAALQTIPGSPTPDVSTAVRAMRALVQHNVVTSAEDKLFQDLRGLRNQVVMYDNSFTLQEATAQKYIELATGLEARLLDLANPIGG